ncbi:metallophosphoesterase [Flavobacterium sp.]|uniref:metallophosphoesterase n=1 Tax=Flavobacterium sp. TaxID=239 RepID=UPI00286AFB32|nr:metallophosphoesterase [Flavobacterium sp.]
MRTLVIGDIHGGLRALHQIFERAQITPQDRLIFLGDYVDGWSESPQVLDFLIQLQSTHSCIFMRGNHDELLCHWLHESKDNQMWYRHGGESTVKAYAKVDSKTKKRHVLFLQSLENYYLDNQNRLFIHAGFTNMNGVTSEHFPKLFYWERTLWETALSLDKSLGVDSLLYPRRLKLYKEIYIGHTPVTQIGETTPIQMACVWNVDTGAAFKGPLTVLDVDTKTYWQSDPLPDLYPNEIGRN